MADVEIFSTAEARAFNGAKLANETTYLTATLTAKEVEIREAFDRILGCNCVRTTHTAEIHDGDGSDYLKLKWPKVYTVSAISVDGTAFTASDLSTTDYDAGLAIDSELGVLTRRSGVFDAGWSNVSVTYVAGWEYVPDLLKRAALIIATTEIPASNVPYSADDYDAGGMSVSFARGDGFNGAWWSMPEVVKALRLYTYKLPGIA